MINLYSCYKAGFCLAIAAILGSCSPTDKPEQQAKAPSPIDGQTAAVVQAKQFSYTFQDQPEVFNISAIRGDQIHLPSGTSIKIPDNCFVDAEGNKIKGDVKIEFEEFLSAGSIISSQINMKFGSGNFESAGMFRINAFKNNEPVFIAKDKAIDVTLASTDNADNFRSYYSTENGDDWKDIGSSEVTMNTTRQQKIDQLQEELKNAREPEKPLSFETEGKYFDLNLNNNYARDLDMLIGVVWEFAGKNQKLNPALNAKIFNREWISVSITPDQNDKLGVYDIWLVSRDTSIHTTARPVFRGKALDAANEEFQQQLGEFNRRMNQIRNEEKQAQAESEFLRQISVKNLGLYNYDRQYHSSDMVPVLADFNFGTDSLKNYPISVYLITGNGMAVIKYPPSDWDKFRYSRKETNRMIAILPNQEICTFSNFRFQKEGPKFPETAPGKYTFKLNHTGIKATNSKAIDQVLSTI